MSIKTVGPGSPVGDEALRLWLVNHIKQHPHLTTTHLAREAYIGTSRAALDQYLNGKYFLPRENGGQGVDPKKSNLEQKIRAYRERIEGTERHGFTNSFMTTRTYYQVMKACETAISENVIVVIYGRPGVGKTRCLMEFSIDKMTTLPIGILCSRNITPRYFVQKIAQQVGVDDRPATARLEDLIAEKLKKSPRPLFVDQANYLHEKSLGTICYLWEIAKIPVVLFGTKDLYELFNTSRLTEDVRAQLSSRVAMHYPLEGLTAEEVKTIVRKVMGDQATDEVIAEVWKRASGVHRHVDMGLPRVLQLAQANEARLASGKVTMVQIVQQAFSRLMT
jgi:DNA transposition AAA+ family ATPase